MIWFRIIVLVFMIFNLIVALIKIDDFIVPVLCSLNTILLSLIY